MAEFIKNLAEAKEFVNDVKSGAYKGAEALIKAGLLRIKELIANGDFTWSRINMSEFELGRYLEEASNILANKY